MSMTHKVLFAFFALAFVLTAFGAQARDTRIAAVVNEDAISMTDVEDRMKLIIVSSGLPNTKDVRAKVMPQVIDALIEEQIRMQEAKRNNLDVTEEEVYSGFKTIADQNKFTPEQFEQIMKQQGVPKSTLMRQIRAQIAWTKVVKDVLRPRVRVTQNDAEARLKRMQKNIGKTEYLTAEIFLPVEDASKENEIATLAQQLTREIQKGAPFPAVAAQFSKAPGAAETGGIIGWVQDGQLEGPLDQKLSTLEAGQVSDPVKSTLGYHILMLREKRVVSAKSFPNNDDLINQIGIERLDRVQQKYLSDLKAAAYIDRRV